MSRVRFFREGGAAPFAACDALPGTLLLDLARLEDIPLHWRCGQGTCGTCLVRLVHAEQPGEFTPGNRERNVLTRFGRAPCAAKVWPDTAETWRLACHVEVGETDLDVWLPA